MQDSGIASTVGMASIAVWAASSVVLLLAAVAKGRIRGTSLLPDLELLGGQPWRVAANAIAITPVFTTAYAICSRRCCGQLGTICMLSGELCLQVQRSGHRALHCERSILCSQRTGSTLCRSWQHDRTAHTVITVALSGSQHLPAASVLPCH